MRVKYNNETFDLQYEIFDDGFEIYLGDRKFPLFKQREPFIPDPSKSYEENAIAMCKEYCDEQNNGNSSTFVPVEDRLTAIEANIDYLMLLNDPDSAAEEPAQ